jgi:uncharacterized PurR-regulated membrane protein YhhQ (DUF165 family)
MTVISKTIQARNYLFFSVAMITCLALLISLSFKIIAIQDFSFVANSILCPVIAGMFLIILKECTLTEQKQVLNQALLALYLFSIGVYLLVNLPTLDNMRANIAYKVFFEDIPRKFFSATLAFILAFYLPFFCITKKNATALQKEKNAILFLLVGGGLFFTIDFLLLFADPMPQNFLQLYKNSLSVTLALLFIIAFAYALFFLKKTSLSTLQNNKQTAVCYHSSLYQYLVSFSVIILLICLACEYRLISFGHAWVIVASGIIFPIDVLVSNLVGELYGYKANLRIIGFLLFSELLFNVILTLVMMLPSPDFFDLNLFYSELNPRRIPAATIALIFAMGGNAFLLEKFKNTWFDKHQSLRILTANIISNSLLCFVNYSILFVGIYPYDLILHLVINSWAYKMVITLISLPLIVWLYGFCQTKNSGVGGQAELRTE